MTGDAQYVGDKHLATRIAFHERYTHPYIDLSKWIFERIPFAPGQRVLELGCGNGEFWVRNAGCLAEGLSLTLTDLSPGMLDIASDRLSKAGVMADYETVSADDLPFDASSYDIIIAKHMLYHVRNRERALREIRRVLRLDGTFCATTNGSPYMQEIYDLMGVEGVRWTSGEAATFTMENGAEQLSACFDDVETILLEGKLRVTKPEAVSGYIESLATLYDDPEKIFDAARRAYLKVAQEILDHGVFVINKRSGLFLCR